MYYNNLVIILYILCTLQLQPYLLTMASKQSANTSTSMTKEQGPMPPAQNTAHGKKKSSVAVTLSTHNPAPTSAVHKYVTDVAELISASADTRKMFLTEVTKKCLEMAKKEKDSKQQSSTPVKLPESVTYPNYGHGQIFPPKESDVLDKRIDHYALPTTNTTSSITSTVISTSTSSDTVTSPVTTAPIGMSTPQHRRDPINMYRSGYNTSGSEMRRRFEEGKPNQALTLFAPVGMAEDLTKTQFILCSKIKTELKAVKESIAAIPFQELNKQVHEVANNLEERMCALENTYKDLKELILAKNNTAV